MQIHPPGNHKTSDLRFQVRPIVVLPIRVVSVPVPPLPERRRHFIQELTLSFVAEDKFP